jgi:hypothetical protein
MGSRYKWTTKGIFLNKKHGVSALNKFYITEPNKGKLSNVIFFKKSL